MPGTKKWSSTINAIFISFALAVLSGCAGMIPGEAVPAHSDEARASDATENPDVSGLDTAVTTGALAGFPRSLPSWPVNGRPVFAGYTNRLRDREQESETALRNAAEQASRYVSLTAVYQYVARTDGRQTGSVDAVEAEWDEARVDSFLATLEVIRSEQLHEGTIVYAALDEPLRSSIPQIESISGAGAEPDWINRPPEIPGYIVGVGAAQSRRTMAESLAAADERALVDILLQTSATIRLLDQSRTRERSTQTMTTVSQQATAALSGFLVLSRHVSPDGRTFYALAVAQEGR
jgi:hypothetical protein